MPRKKKTTNSETTMEGSTTITDSAIDNSFGPSLFQRDSHGLLKNVQYVFHEDGSIDWRAMIGDSHLFPNRDWFKTRNQAMPSTVEGLQDHQLLIKLSGIKELARLRGFSDVSFHTEKCSEEHVAVTCTITFIPNYETGGEHVRFQDMANATINNTSDFGQIFLETIACNRAFVRCIRNFLNVHIVGDDEINKSKGKPMAQTSPALTPSSILETNAQNKLNCHSFLDFKEVLREWWRDDKYKNEAASNWSSWDDVPAAEARALLKVVNA
tara:strand:+ start:95381 stop:96187 length:807 start_codon:yes stop_codon:yes gene_type:complete